MAKAKSKEPRDCFVISPIGEAGSETRKRSDQILKHVIRPAVIECGYHAVRADEIDKPGMITSQVIQRVVSDPLVVADLTDRNPNVFYELAIRHAIRQPLVQLIKKGERIPFDVAQTRTIQVDHHDLDSVDTARTEIVKQVKALEQDVSDLETPISVSIELQRLRQSEDPEERSLAELVDAVADLRSGFSKLESRLGPAEGEGVLDQIRSDLKVLPSRLEETLGGPRTGRRLHVSYRYYRELIMVARKETTRPIGILIAASLFKNDFPWLYELGIEAYRQAKNRSMKAASDTIDSFIKLSRLTMRGPWAHEFLAMDEDHFFLLEEVPQLLEAVLQDLPRQKRNKP